MSRHHLVRPVLTALVALTPFALPAAAAPAVAPTSLVQGESLAQPVACWWRSGIRHCNGRHAGNRYYGYGPSYGYRPSYGYSSRERSPESLPFGSTAWWRAMDREGRGGYRR